MRRLVATVAVTLGLGLGLGLGVSAQPASASADASIGGIDHYPFTSFWGYCDLQNAFFWYVYSITDTTTGKIRVFSNILRGTPGDSTFCQQWDGIFTI